MNNYKKYLNFLNITLFFDKIIIILNKTIIIFSFFFVYFIYFNQIEITNKQV